MEKFKSVIKGYIEKKEDNGVVKTSYEMRVEPITLEGEATLDLSDLPPEDREKICNLLRGLYDEKTKSCIVRIRIDNKDPIKVKILRI